MGASAGGPAWRQRLERVQVGRAAGAHHMQLRATESVGLLQQMVGRGLRIDGGKSDCLILDYDEMKGAEDDSLRLF